MKNQFHNIFTNCGTPCIISFHLPCWSLYIVYVFPQLRAWAILDGNLYVVVNRNVLVQLKIYLLWRTIVHFNLSPVCQLGNVTSSIRNIPPLNFRPTNFPTCCNIGPTPAVYFCIIWGLQVRLRQFLCRVLRLGQARGPRAAATSPYSSCKTTC